MTSSVHVWHSAMFDNGIIIPTIVSNSVSHDRILTLPRQLAISHKRSYKTAQLCSYPLLPQPREFLADSGPAIHANKRAP